MTDKVNKSPTLPHPISLHGVQGIVLYIGDLVKSLINELGSHANRLNIAIVSDGTEPMAKPFVLASYTVSGVPSASSWAQGLVYISDETGGATLAFSDGTNWRRVQDRTIIS